ncbi:hypothetical protein H6P81_000881 [Aristolochia fimbriata]|uniref:Uncharacterized protein n=1 Tax=Aristolochia fimbriata TaxID=158543 RepID=A0AAV7F5W7_ARIFI|nr:hypothetical protein H6P81_000881 [Aristolochia fimbriata]
MDDALPGSSIARRLASCDKHIRDKALRSLGKWLAAHTDVKDEEFRWIWKGLFYCVWHADKQPVQVMLINRLASLVVSLDTSISIRYFEVFLLTMRREWSGIDFLRTHLDQKKKGDSDSHVEIENLAFIALKMGFAKKFFELASAPETLQGNRKFLFSLHEDFLKLERDFHKSGIEVSALEAKVVADSNVLSYDKVEPFLENVNSLANEDSKKNKKRKKASKQVLENGGEKVDNGDEPNDSLTDNGNPITLDESVISNLQKQFEKAAAEAGMDMDAIFVPMPTGPVNATSSKKRRRAKSMDGTDGKQASAQQSDDEVEGGNEVGKSGDKSSKKVRFAMKKNLVWKPHSPLPPQSLRLPPSATPRGSALKKGVPPGPISENPAVKKKMKQKW